MQFNCKGDTGNELYVTTPTTGTLGLIPSGRAGIVETLKAMSRFVRDGKKSFPIQQAAISRTQSCASKDYACEVRVLHRFVRDSIRYVQDTTDVETVRSAQKTLEYAAGDCDDKSVLLAALLEAIGHPTRFVAVGEQPGMFTHVYVETKIGANWIPLETTENVAVGWQPDPRDYPARLEFYN